MTEIAVFVEGGGGTAALRAELRQGFDALFTGEKRKASSKKLGLRFTICGGRDEAYKAFMNELKVNSTCISALLVDSETSISAVPAIRSKDALIRVTYLRSKEGADGRGQGDGWTLPDKLAARVHLMVQCMEAWIVADPDALESFYKANFRQDKLPKRSNLEEEPKADIYSKLEKATEETQKGKYGKIKHASKLLALVDPEKVAKHCPRFVIFQEWLNESIENPPAKA